MEDSAFSDRQANCLTVEMLLTWDTMGLWVPDCFQGPPLTQRALHAFVLVLEHVLSQF